MAFPVSQMSTKIIYQNLINALVNNSALSQSFYVGLVTQNNPKRAFYATLRYIFLLGKVRHRVHVLVELHCRDI